MGFFYIVKGELTEAGKIGRYENHEFSVEDNILTIKVNLDEEEVDVKPSKSGKTQVLATSGGAVRIPGTEYRVNLTVYR